MLDTEISNPLNHMKGEFMYLKKKNSEDDQQFKFGKRMLMLNQYEGQSIAANTKMDFLEVENFHHKLKFMQNKEKVDENYTISQADLIREKYVLLQRGKKNAFPKPLASTRSIFCDSEAMLD